MDYKNLSIYQSSLFVDNISKQKYSTTELNKFLRNSFKTIVFNDYLLYKTLFDLGAKLSHNKNITIKWIEQFNLFKYFSKKFKILLFNQMYKENIEGDINKFFLKENDFFDDEEVLCEFIENNPSLTLDDFKSIITFENLKIFKSYFEDESYEKYITDINTILQNEDILKFHIKHKSINFKEKNIITENNDNVFNETRFQNFTKYCINNEILKINENERDFINHLVIFEKLNLIGLTKEHIEILAKKLAEQYNKFSINNLIMQFNNNKEIKINENIKSIYPSINTYNSNISLKFCSKKNNRIYKKIIKKIQLLFFEYLKQLFNTTKYDYKESDNTDLVHLYFEHYNLTKKFIPVKVIFKILKDADFYNNLEYNTLFYSSLYINLIRLNTNPFKNIVKNILLNFSENLYLYYSKKGKIYKLYEFLLSDHLLNPKIKDLKTLSYSLILIFKKYKILDEFVEFYTKKTGIIKNHKYNKYILKVSKYLKYINVLSKTKICNEYFINCKQFKNIDTKIIINILNLSYKNKNIDFNKYLIVNILRILINRFYSLKSQKNFQQQFKNTYNLFKEYESYFDDVVINVQFYKTDTYPRKEIIYNVLKVYKNLLNLNKDNVDYNIRLQSYIELHNYETKLYFKENFYENFSISDYIKKDFQIIYINKTSKKVESFYENKFCLMHRSKFFKQMFESGLIESQQQKYIVYDKNEFTFIKTLISTQVVNKSTKNKYLRSYTSYKIYMEVYDNFSKDDNLVKQLNFVMNDFLKISLERVDKNFENDRNLIESFYVNLFNEKNKDEEYRKNISIIVKDNIIVEYLNSLEFIVNGRFGNLLFNMNLIRCCKNLINLYSVNNWVNIQRFEDTISDFIFRVNLINKSKVSIQDLIDEFTDDSLKFLYMTNNFISYNNILNMEYYILYFQVSNI